VARYDIELFAPEYDDSIVDRDGSWSMVELQLNTAFVAGVPKSIAATGAAVAVNGLGIELSAPFGNLTFPRGWYTVKNTINLSGTITSSVNAINRSTQNFIPISTRIWDVFGAPGTEGNPNSLTGVVPFRNVVGRLDTGVNVWTVEWIDLLYSDGVTGNKNYNPGVEFIGSITTLQLSALYPGSILILPLE
jgi:hypothetical protein